MRDLNKTDPFCIEQSLMGFLKQLGQLTADTYNDIINELFIQGKLRYSDFNRVMDIYQSPDGQYLGMLIGEERAKIRTGGELHTRMQNQLKPYLGIVMKLYPEIDVIFEENFQYIRDYHREVSINDTLVRANLRQHKTTLNVYAEELPLKIKKGLAIANLKNKL